MTAVAEEVGRAFEALGDPTRRAILKLLIDRPQPVGTLAEQFPVSRPAVSQHLKILKTAGLVIDRAEGTRRIYHVNPEGVLAMRNYLQRMWDTALAAFAAAIENDADQPEGHDR